MTELAEIELYDFGLSPEQEARAQRLHRESLIADMLFLGPCSPTLFTDEMNAILKAEYSQHGNAPRAYWSAMSLPARLAAAGEFPAFKAIWDATGVTVGSRECGIGSFEEIVEQIGNFQLQFDSFPWLLKARRAADIRRAWQEGKRAAFIHTQDTRSIELDLNRLKIYHDLGMRMVQLTYNHLNFVGAGCTERTDAGLSYFGCKVVERLNDLGIIIDISHTGRQSGLDACRISQAPVIASHTGAKAISGHDRCKSDEELEAIAATGGIIGVFTAPAFLSRKPEPTIEDFLDHIDYLVTRVGVEHVGIGTDWPNCAPLWLLSQLDEWTAELGFRPEHRVKWTTMLRGFSDYRQFINITRGLVARGYSDAQIKLILGENFLRVFEVVCG